MMLKRILREAALKDFIKEECSENGICVDFNEKIDADDYVIVKVDDYYNSLNAKGQDTPPSPDCLIVLRCGASRFKLVLVELKDIDSAKRFSIDNLLGKFKTCLEDFIGKRFKELFDYEIKQLDLFFVSEISFWSNRNDPARNMKLKVLMNKRFKFRGRSYMIKPHNPTPLIKPCY